MFGVCFGRADGSVVSFASVCFVASASVSVVRWFRLVLFVWVGLGVGA